MNDLKPGDPCFLIGLRDFEALTGRVVEVIGPVPTPDDECGTWFAVRAGWASELFQGRDVTVQRCNLKPITPPAPVARVRETSVN